MLSRKKVLIIEQYNLFIFDLRFNGFSHDKYIEENRNKCVGKLEQVGWNKDEINLYNKIRTTTLELKNIFDLNFINILIIRYAKINKIKLPENFRFKRNHELPTNEGKEIMSNLLLMLINEKIQYILDNMGEEIFYGDRIIKDIIKKDDKFQQQHDLGSTFTWFFNLYDIFDSVSFPSLIEKELKDMLLSYFLLLRPPVGNLDLSIAEYVDKVRIEILHLQKFKPVSRQDMIITNFTKLKIKSMKFFLMTYKEYCDKIGYHSYFLDYITLLIKDPSKLPSNISFRSMFGD